MIDALLVEAAMNNQQLPLSSLSDLGQLFGKPVADFWGEYLDSRGFTVLHEVLLRINHGYGTLEDYLVHIAAERTDSLLIDTTDWLGRSALDWATEHGWADAVATLVKFGANVNQYTTLIRGSSPVLHHALAGPACGQLEPEFLNIVKILLTAGADVNAIDHEGWTPLHIAASWNSQHAVDTLLACARGPLNWKAITNDGKSAAQLAADSGGDPEFVELLFKGLHT
jgi:ankyrin repeat protein